MSFISCREIEVTTLALDGLSARQKLLTANVANADTPGYKRADLRFENQLADIIQEDRAQEYLRQNPPAASMSYNMQGFQVIGEPSRQFTASKEVLEQKYKSFKPEFIESSDAQSKPNGNNVNIEQEMVELSKNGMKYTAISQFQEKKFRGLSDIIKGGGL